MLTVKPRFTTFEEYISYNDDSDQVYELFNGELIEVPPESGLNIQIANRLFLFFALINERLTRDFNRGLAVLLFLSTYRSR